MHVHVHTGFVLHEVHVFVPKNWQADEAVPVNSLVDILRTSLAAYSFKVSHFLAERLV